MKVIKIFFCVFLFWISLTLSQQTAYAQQCSSSGITCCEIDPATQNCLYSFPGSCDSNCNIDCGAGEQEIGDTGYCSYNNGLPGGGGGAYQYPTCGGGTVLKCGSDPRLYAPASTTENCFFRGTCGDSYFPSLFTETACDGVSTKGTCQANCGCCGPTDSYTKSTTTGGTYSKTVSCQTANSSACNDWDDTVVTRTYGTAATTCYCDCPDPDLGCGAQCNKNGGSWRYNDTVTCRTVTTTWSCVPNCTASAPSVTTLLSPSNGVALAAGTVNLSWNPSITWGTSCTTTNRTFEVFIGTSAGSMASIGSVTQASGISSIAYNSAVAGPTYYWKVTASNGQLSTDSATWTFTIANAGAWWQVKDGDITTNNDISSDVPTGQLFNIAGLGGFHGVPVFGSTFNLTSTPELISENSWNANTTTSQSRLFMYSYFENLIPDDVKANMVVATEDSLKNGTGYKMAGDDYEWYKASGSLATTSDIDFGSRKVILFVENGGLSIGGKINLTDGQGFFGAFVEGNIVVDPAVTGTPSIEGIYLTDLGFSSGVSTSPLHIRGSVASFGTVTLGRDLVDNSDPAELFEFAPDQMLLFPQRLGFRRSRWAEIAP